MKIHIPTPLRPYAGKNATVDVPGGTVADGLKALTERYPDLRKNIFNDEGKVRSFVNVYLNDEDVRYLAQKDQSPVKDGDQISIIPSIAGGVAPAARRLS
jgi:molybdopterin converting factor small subunit